MYYEELTNKIEKIKGIEMKISELQDEIISVQLGEFEMPEKRSIENINFARSGFTSFQEWKIKTLENRINVLNNTLKNLKGER